MVQEEEDPRRPPDQARALHASCLDSPSSQCLGSRKPHRAVCPGGGGPAAGGTAASSRKESAPCLQASNLSRVLTRVFSVFKGALNVGPSLLALVAQLQSPGPFQGRSTTSDDLGRDRQTAFTKPCL